MIPQDLVEAVGCAVLAVNQWPLDKVWDTLSPENRTRMVRAVVARVEVDEPRGDVRAFQTDLGPDAEEVARAIEVTP
ncbi:MAG TPA: hypothetical protein PLC99_14005 [Verrucomicrobiota bacterium]|nr:hypothetical protein [Verrucomicrobiota bacterium]